MIKTNLKWFCLILLVFFFCFSFKAKAETVEELVAIYGTGTDSEANTALNQIRNLSGNRNNYPSDPIDFTQTPRDIDGFPWILYSCDYNLGPTGARGWVWSERTVTNKFLYSEVTARAHQIQITRIEPGSPAQGILQYDDVIIGAGGQQFTDHARRNVSAAITEAEKAANQGKLNLTIKRNGTTQNVTIQLKVMGTFSETAPYNCPKTDAIIQDAKTYVANSLASSGSSMKKNIMALGLLAIGESQYWQD